ncbi:MAG: hypothetical protein M5U32_11080 [Myxococcota bacterium]|nr:hypothetical protein [Myxococcota bacterium]
MATPRLRLLDSQRPARVVLGLTPDNRAPAQPERLAEPQARVEQQQHQCRGLGAFGLGGSHQPGQLLGRLDRVDSVGARLGAPALRPAPPANLLAERGNRRAFQ